MKLRKFEGAEIFNEKLDNLNNWSYDGDNIISNTIQGAKKKYFIELTLDDRSGKLEHIVVKTAEDGRLSHHEVPQKIHDKVEKFIRFLISERSS